MIIIDAHVHWHDEVTLDELLSAAWTNGVNLTEQENSTLECCVLFLVDMAGEDSLRSLHKEPTSAWEVSAMEDDAEAVLLSGRLGERVLSVTGRQVSTITQTFLMRAVCRKHVICAMWINGRSRS